MRKICIARDFLLVDPLQIPYHQTSFQGWFGDKGIHGGENPLLLNFKYQEISSQWIPSNSLVINPVLLS
jgi:hypothetical protein